MNRPYFRPPEFLDLDTLVALAERKAAVEADGHFSLLRFTTGWKCMLGTPDLDSGRGRKQVSALKTYRSPREALISFLLRNEADES
jgi:hypothetical protein